MGTHVAGGGISTGATRISRRGSHVTGSMMSSLITFVLRLDNGRRCKVIAVEKLEACGEVVLTLQPCDSISGETAVCVLRGSWTSTVVREGDVVSVTATQMSNQPGCWVVDNDAGMLTTHPDTLVSGTTIVGSLFCTRRSVLSDMYRGMDADSSIMVMGSFLHQLLQEVLKRKVSSLEGINGVLSEFVSSRHFIFSLYSSGMPLDETKESLSEFVPKIHAFVQKYINNSSAVTQPTNWNSKESWSGTITDVADIEENIWTPKLGIKGKVDVTVKTHKQNIKKVMPLELKTGRASFSAEHRGQVILYTMMMSELGQTVDSGLLLYLREGVMKEVKVGVAERRDLMLLRNQLVSELRASHRVVVADNHQVAPPSLPHPINHHSACAKCPYLTLCSSALRVSGSEELSNTNPLQGLSVASTAHLQMEHMLYVFHWTGLLRLEHTDNQLRSPALHDIWTLPPAERRKRGTCVPEVRLVGEVTEVTVGSYEHVFEWDCEGGCPLAEGDYVIVSSQSRPAVAAGPVRHLAECQLTLHLERDLSVQQKEDMVWHLDRYESQSGLVFNMTNLGSLLDNTEQAGRLRKAVIDLEVPSFNPKLSSRVLKASVDVMALLNDQQKKAIFRTLAAEHYILIKGMPGTGKTATVVALVQLAVRLGLSVLITSHTHSAVDNVLLKLRGLVDFLRLGAVHKLHPELTDYGESRQVFSSPQEMQAFYDSKNVVAVTCLGSSHPLLTRRQFDLCIVDESGQVLQPTVLRPLFSARKFVLIGDPEQLPPLVRSTKAKELGLGQSLFARLDRPAVTSELSLQYRMNQRITNLANTLTYNGRLQCGSPEVASATLSLPKPLVNQPDWVGRALGSSLDQAVIVLDTGKTEAVDCTNVTEAEVVLKIVTALGQRQNGGRPDVHSLPQSQRRLLTRAQSACSLPWD
ncbi:Tripartite DNA replication factor [Homalodisca vitripennis]|nr:Tripartite DNA replication factor [Homalodisca vitripennis]